MFFHPKYISVPLVKELSKKDVASLTAHREEFYKRIGLKPIRCLSKILPDFRNDFGWLRNDIQQFLRAGDASVQASILANLNTVTQSGANKGVSIQDLYDSIIPNNVQTPADIERFGRIMASRYEGRLERSAPVKDLSEKVEFTKEDKSVTDDK